MELNADSNIRLLLFSSFGAFSALCAKAFYADYCEMLEAKQQITQSGLKTVKHTKQNEKYQLVCGVSKQEIKST